MQPAALERTFYFRPICQADIDALTAMVKLSTGGLSSLQPRREFLMDYIKASEQSFSGSLDIDRPHKYLMALFDKDRLIGCAAVKTQTGIENPFINFDLIGDGLDQYLAASTRFQGATEVGSLFLHPNYRKDGLGRYLAKARYMLMASEPWRFGETVIAELRGICSQQGSPLYDYLFRNKLERSFLEADTEYYDRNPDTLGDIVPIGKIPLAKFPIDVRASIGQPHPSGIGAMRLLQKEGFIFSGTIDLFDAGPIVHAYRDTIRTIRNRKAMTLQRANVVKPKEPVLIALGKVSDFRAVVTLASITDDTIIAVSPDILSSLKAEEGDTVHVWSESGENDLLVATNANRLVDNTPKP